MDIYVVKSGDSLYKIAKNYGVSADKIASDNGIDELSPLVVGQSLVIITKPDTPKLGGIEVNGYTYPNVDQAILKQTLPNLTYLSIFSYEANYNGTLDPIDDNGLIKLAKDNGVAPIMVVTNKEFSGDVTDKIFNDYNVQTRLLNNIIYILNTKGYYGVNFDFEFIYEKDKQGYNNFLDRANSMLDPLGYKIFTSLAPKTSSEQTGRLYTAHDYDAHGALVDRIILMTYEWGYTYSEPMAVAPIDKVSQVLDYAVKAIPANKILMGVPNYGYDWTLPWVSGVAAKAIGNAEAVILARNINSNINYDQKAQSPYYNYYDKNKKQHEVWFEDARSLKEKLLLVNKYNLAGISYWTIDKFYKTNWTLVNFLYNVVKVDI